MANLPHYAGPNIHEARHQTFSALYQDATLDPCQGNYGRIMDRFDPEVNNAISRVFLFEQAVTTGPTLQAYLCCTQRQNQTKIFCLHLPSRYTEALDGQTTPWDGVAFACLGETTCGQVTTVILPDDCFCTIHNTRAKTTDYIVTHLDNLGAYGLPAITVDEPEANQVSTRALMYLPAR
jgi:hypothetical protein